MNERRPLRILFANLALIFVIFLIPQVAAANIVITEIMYDAPGSDSGREWIEIYNDGPSATSLSGWRLLEGGTKHKLTAILGDETIPPQGYAVIAANTDVFRSEWPQFSGQLFDSAFSLSSGGETLALLDASLTVISSASYQGSAGASGDGNSLSRINAQDIFTPRTPTPGTDMAASAIQLPPAKQAENKSTATSKQKNTEPKDSLPNTEETETIPDAISTIENGSLIAGERQTAAIVFSKSSLPWWGAAGAVAVAAGGAIFFSRSLKPKEWDIVEEIE